MIKNSEIFSLRVLLICEDGCSSKKSDQRARNRMKFGLVFGAGARKIESIGASDDYAENC